MRIHGDAPDDEVAHAGVVERPDNGFEAGEFHGGWGSGCGFRSADNLLGVGGSEKREGGWGFPLAGGIPGLNAAIPG